MQQDFLSEVQLHSKRHRRRSVWRNIVRVLACVVVFITTYALILPAITLEAELPCGVEEHTHTSECYEEIPTGEENLVCSLKLHIHDDNCYDADHILTCGYADFAVHTHSENCSNSEGDLICTLAEIEEHVHSESCYTEASEGHVHTEVCYSQVRGALLCQQEESSGHTHGDECYSVSNRLSCTLEQAEGHTHDENCYTDALTCGREETDGHSHGDDCYETRTDEEGNVIQVLICETVEAEAHRHSTECYTREWLCTQEESEGHTHTDACYEKDLICTQEETAGHTHSDECFQIETVLSCGMEPSEAVEAELICTQAVIQLHTHDESCYEIYTDEDGQENRILICEKLEIREHKHDDTCFTDVTESVLTCEKEEHTHILICYSDPTADVETAADWEKTIPTDLTGSWADDLVAVAKSQMGYTESKKNYIVLEDGATVKGYTRYGAWYGDEYGDWCAMFVSFCLNYAGVEGMPYHSNCDSWIAALSGVDLYAPAAEHTPQAGDLIFFDHDGDGLSNHVGIVAAVKKATDETPAQVKTIEGNSADQVQYLSYDMDDATILGYGMLPHQLTEEEMAAVQEVIAMIDAMPSADEIDAKIEEFEAAEDYEGEEAWLTDVYQQVAEAYYYYSQLSDDQKSVVTNADKLLELEYIWSVTEYSANSGTPPVDTGPVHAVNSYGTVGSGFYSILIYGGSYDEVMAGTANAGMAFQSWKAIVVSTDSDGNLYVEKYVNDSSDKSTLKPSNTSKGFVLLYSYTYTYFDFVAKYNAGTKIYASVNFDYTSTGAVYKSTGYGTISFDTNVFVKKTATESAAPTPLESAHTSEFIELNLYDYGSNINTLYNNNKYSYTDWNYATKYTSYYPGFQWNGGAYVKSDLVDSTSGTADRNHIDSIDFGNSLITDLKYSGSTHAKSSTATDITFFADSGTYSINAMDYYYKNSNYADYGVNNRPIGFSIADSITDTSYDVLKRTLGSDGYPVIKANGASLAYLFTNNTYATKQNTTSIDGLFLQDATTGEYYYNSRWNHAQYSNNKFTLYDEILTPNFITYPFGNFMPFNDITDSEDATQVSKITSMGNYVDYILDQLYPYTLYNYAAGFDSSRNQLYYMLNQYKSNVKYYGIHSKTWSTFSASDAIWDYFTGGGANEGDSPSDDTGFLTNTHLSDMYNIDYDVEKNFFFGMEMKMNFYQPKDGLTGNDNNGDGTPDYNMEFYFTGDDDVWVYIDGVLFLDLTGIHRHVGGKIDFVNGKVYYYALDISTGDVSETPYATYTFKQILEAAGASTVNLNDKGTFEDYTTHSFNFFYMERGSGSSVCRLNFNFPLLRQNSITVEKELADDDSTEIIEALGNPDFLFQVLDADDDSLFLPDGWAYSLYDVDGSVIQQIEVTEKYQDGRVKTMVIKDGAGNELCREEYDSNGTMKNRTGSGQDKVLRIGDDGIFALKAGQKAEFVGIPETAGKYYVRELLEQTVVGQYGTITVSGTAVTPENMTVGGVSYSGVNSPVLDMTNGSSTFRVKNTITTAKLGSLSITKNLDAAYSGNTDKTFTFSVTVDGEPLPEGTTYTVGGETRTVTVDKDSAGNVTASYVEVPADETAVISNIIAGTTFEVTETAESAKGYTVSYAVGTTNSSASAKGTVGLDEDVTVTVTNSEIGTYVDIPIAKTMSYFGNGSRTFQFMIEQVADQNGTALGQDEEKYSFTTEPLNEPIAAEPFTKHIFKINYTSNDVPTDTTKTYYYKISEVEGTAAIRYDTKYYIVKVVVTNANDVMSAEVTDIWQVDSGTTTHINGTDMTDTTILFTNTILRNLIISKTVTGTGDKSGEFTFTLKLDKNDSNADLPTELVGTKTNADGTATAVSYQLSNGVVTFTLKDGETIKFTNIPYRSMWTLTETAVNGFATSYTITTKDGTKEYTGNTAKDQLASAANTTVAFTNAKTYILPETGGAGTTCYTMAGLMLMLCSMAFLLYRFKIRRREDV